MGDLVLGRPDTAFLDRCRRQGAATVAGIDILAAQASLNFFLWTEAMFPRTLMRDVLLQELEGSVLGGFHLLALAGTCCSHAMRVTPA